MTRYWKVEEAEANFSRVLREAEKEPQIITRHGKPVATVIPGVERAALKPPRSVWELLRGDFTFTAPEGENWDDWLERGVHAPLPRQPRRAGEVRAWLERQILPVYGAYVPPFDLEAARQQPPARTDSLIAATAYVHRLTLATRNTADFLAFPSAVFNPWAP